MADSSKIVAGIDVGSLFTKAVILSPTQKVLSYNIMRSGADYSSAAENCLGAVLQSCGLKNDDIGYVVATGYGRANVAFANERVTEITCHARGAQQSFPGVRTVIDIGGQDSKVICINEKNQISNFVMNDKCAAGTGRFLEVMAGALEVSLEQLGKISLESQTRISISNTCTVFAESEVISLFAAAHLKSDIAAAIMRAIARRIVGMVGQLGLQEPAAMTGGVAKNIGVVRALEEELHTRLLISDEPQINGAFGAAIIAVEHFKA